MAEPETRGTDIGVQREVRCSRCGHFLCKIVLIQGQVVIMLVCRGCKARLEVTISLDDVVIRQA